MYLTRIALNRRRRDAANLLGSRHAMHAAVEACFPPKLDGTARDRNLWRLDRNGDQTWLYLVSETRPDPTSLIEQAGWPDAESTHETAEYARLLDKVRDGAVFSFRTNVNPSEAKARPADSNGVRKSGKVTPITGEQNQLAWFARKAETNGFRIVDGEHGTTAAIVSSGTDSFQRGGQTVKVTSATITGVLQVADAEKFIAALTGGIGRSKAFGCGLLTIAKA